MRTPQRGLSSAALLILVAFLSFGLALPLQAQLQVPPQDQEWSVRDAYGFRSRNLSMGTLFQLRIDGRSSSPTTSSFQKTSVDRAQNESKLDFEADYSTKPIAARREMRIDPKRRAVRIIDIFTNTESQERNLRVDYTTSLSERGGMRYGGLLNQAGESREYGNGVPDDTVAALIFAERQDSQALPLFLWGQAGARWPVNIQDVGSSVTLSYEGIIPANGKVALLHWVAVAGMDKQVKLERTADLFWKDGRLVDPMVPAEVAPLIANFTTEALKATPVPAATLAQAAGRLVSLEELCGKLSVAREGKDVLWMGKDEQFRGTVSGATVQMRTGDRTVELPLAGIAAIRGGGGRGREHRVYLRDGSVLTGRATLSQCRLAGDLGELTLDADALELLLMGVSPEDGKVPSGAVAFAQLQNGALYWLERQDAAGLDLVTVFGSLRIPFDELWLLERRTEPPFNLIATLAEGSRIHGVAQQPLLDLPVLATDGKIVPTQVRTAEIVRLGSAELLAKEMALSSSAPYQSSGAAGNTVGKTKAEPPARYCWLRDGSLLVGALTSSPLKVHAGGNDMEIKTEDITHMAIDAASTSHASIELRSGAKVQGELMSEFLGWQLGAREISIPAGWLTEIVRRNAGSSEPPSDPSTVRGPLENDPLALPRGFAREDLVEMKIDYPKATAEGPLRISGAISLPRLDKCDEESVRKRLTFLVPKGTTNVALKRPATVSAPDTIVGSLDTITDGSARDDGGEHVAMVGGLQWMQIDLGARHHVWKVLLWHYHRMPVVYQDVIVQVSDDPDFRKGVATIFNNDHDNSASLGKGPDIAYVETNHGWLMDGCGAQGRYVRFYSQGNSYSEKNDYLEAMVFGTPVTPKAPTPSAATNKPNDPSRVPTGFAQADMVTMTMTFPSDPASSFPRPVSAAKFPHLEQAGASFRQNPPLLKLTYPKGAKNISRGKTVTSSVKPTSAIGLRAFVDSSAAAWSFLELPAGLQWLQIDLGARHHVWRIALWCYHKEYCVAADVIVQVSDDEHFADGVTTLFNNDHDNSSGLGRGADPAYVETNLGRVIDGSDAKGRYVRFYANGSSLNDLNRFTEAMVFGTPMDAAAPAPASQPASVVAPATPSPSTPAPANSAPVIPSGTSPPVATITPTPAQLQSTAAHMMPNDPKALPPGFPESELVTITPLNPQGSPVSSVIHIASKMVHQEEHHVPSLIDRKSIRVPQGTSRVSAGKPVTTSDRSLTSSKDLAYVTDGHPAGRQSPFLNLAGGLQWVQIDLLAPHRIWKVLLWHEVSRFDVYEDVIVQFSNDPEFAKDIVTIFNNDVDNTSGLGKGPDPAYIETYFGRLMDGGGHVARYVRFYSRGNTIDGHNSYVEAAVYGTREGAEAEAPSIPNTPVPTTPNDPLASPKLPFASPSITVAPTYPKPLYTGSTGFEYPDVPHFEELDVETVKKRLSFQIPRWSYNLAKRKAVTSSAPPLVEGSLARLVDENAEGAEDAGLVLPVGTQWVQIDLGARSYIWKVLLWHAHPDARVAHDVIVQVSEDPTFASGVQTIFNNDHDNSSGLGKGADPAYLETWSGRLMDGCGARGRYLRITSRGSTASPLNHFAEVMVFGKRTPVVGPGPNSGELPLPLAELRLREELQTSDTMGSLSAYPAPAPSLPVVHVDPARFPHLEKRDWVEEHLRLYVRQPLRAYKNVSRGKPVTSSAPKVQEVDLQRATNGGAYFDDVVELPPGLQWVQVDLGTDHRIWNILMWHNHQHPVVYQDVVVQVSSDPGFKKDVTTVFNNDHDNSSGLGRGTDPAYVESHLGRLIETSGVLGRYVRFYSSGNSENDANHFCETWVYGAWEPGIPGSEAPPASSLGQPAGSPHPVGTSVSYRSETASYTYSFANTGPFSVQKRDFPHLEQLDYEKEKARMRLVFPSDVGRLQCESVTSSSAEVEQGKLSGAVDGFTLSPSDPTLPKGLQWIQLDFGKSHQLWYLLLWHDIPDLVVYHDVVVQASEDLEFKTGVHTLFNNDHDNSSGLGAGADPAYLETQFGRLVPGLGVRARYVRAYCRGNSRDNLNRFSEFKVYGREIKDPDPPVAASKPARDIPVSSGTRDPDLKMAGPSSSSSSAQSSADSAKAAVEKPTEARARARAVVEEARSLASPSAPPPLPPRPDSLPASMPGGKSSPNDPLALPKGYTRSQLVEEKPAYPKPMFIGTPVPTGSEIPHLEKMDTDVFKKRLSFLLPRGATNVAKGKTVTSSDPLPIIGTIALATDDDADGADGCYVELAPGAQWLQIDLGSTHQVWKVLLWHFHKQACVYHDVVVQVSDDPEFKKGVHTIFNNDHDDTLRLGKGPDPAYVETHRGRLMDGGGVKGRYIRFYSNGNSANEVNHYVEAMVYGTKAS